MARNPGAAALRIPAPFRRRVEPRTAPARRPGVGPWCRIMGPRPRRGAIADAERAGRPDLVEDNRLELALIEGFLPQGLSAEELEALAKKAVSETGATGPGDLGRVMKALMPQVQGRADGKAVSELVRRLLS